MFFPVILSLFHQQFCPKRTFKDGMSGKRMGLNLLVELALLWKTGLFKDIIQ
jgi:hypothetical protein